MVCGCRPYRQNEPASAAAKIRDHLTIRGREQLHAIGDPTRWRILGRLLESPASIQELAQRAGRGEGHDRPPRARPRGRRADPPGRDDARPRRHREALPARRAPVPAARDGGGGRRRRDWPRSRSARRWPRRDQAAAGRTPRRRSSCARGCPPRARSASPTSINQIAAEFADGAPGTGETFGLVGAIYTPDWAGEGDLT